MELQERLADDDHVQAVEQFISQADHQTLDDAYRGTGSQPFRPERLLAMVMVLILQGIRSPAKWAVHAKNDDRCKLVGRGNQPSRTTLYNCRDRAAKFIEAFHTQMIQDAIQEQHIKEEVELFAPVPERKGSKGRRTDSGQVQITADEFAWQESSCSLRCPVGHLMRQVSRSKDPRADGRHVIELRFEQDESRCASCELADRCLAPGSRRRTVRRLEDQSLMDAQKEKMNSEAGLASGRQRQMRIERRYGDSKKHRGGGELHGRGLTRATAETGLMVVAQNCLTLYLLVKRARTKQT